MAAQTCTHIPSFTGSFRNNLDALIATLEGGDKGPSGKKIGFELERILVGVDGVPIPFSGEHGVGELLRRLADHHGEESRVMIEGHLLGLSYDVETTDEVVSVNISLEPAAQLEISAGPAHSVKALYEAVCSFDREVEEVLWDMGLEAELVAVGYDPFVSSPLELELIPKTVITTWTRICRGGDAMRAT